MKRETYEKNREAWFRNRRDRGVQYGNG